MPQIQFQGTPRPTIGGTIGEGIGRGFEKSMETNRQLSLNQKLEALQNQQKLDFAKKQYLQQQEQMAPFLEQAEKETPGSRLAIQLMGPEKYADMMIKAGPQYITNAFGQGANQTNGFNNLQQMGPQRQMEAPENQIIPIQDREAIDA
jgi:hypothetical protein